MQLLLKKVDNVRKRVHDLERSTTKEQLLLHNRNLEVELKELTEMTKKRLRDLKEPLAQDDLQAAVSMLKITTPMMVSASKVVELFLI